MTPQPDHPVTDGSARLETDLKYLTEYAGPLKGEMPTDHVQAIRSALREVAALRERVAELEARAKALEPYIEHAGDCAAHYAQAETCLSGPCDCELDALQEKHHAD